MRGQSGRHGEERIQEDRPSEGRAGRWRRLRPESEGPMPRESAAGKEKEIRKGR